MENNSKHESLVNMAMAIRQQVIERLHKGSLDYNRDMTALSHELLMMTHLNETLAAGRIFTAMGAIELQKGHFIAAYDYIMASLNAYREVKDEKLTISALSNLGEVHRQWGKHQEALDFYTQAYEMAMQASDWARVSLVLNNIGMLYLEHRDPQHALNQLLASLDYGQREASSSQVMGETYTGIARAYLAMDKIDEAWDAANQALEISRQHNRTDLMGIAFRTLGILATKTGQHAPGDYFKQSRDLLTACNAKAEFARTLIAEAHWLAKTGQVAQACNQIREASELLDSLKLKQEAREACELLASIAPAATG